MIAVPIAVPPAFGAGSAAFGLLAVTETTPGASTLVGAIALLVSALATGYSVIRRAQKNTRNKVETAEENVKTNAEKIDQIDKNAVHRAELEGWKDMITFANQNARQAHIEVGRVREEAAAEHARLRTSNEQIAEQSRICDEDRRTITHDLGQLRGEFDEYRRSHATTTTATATPSPSALTK